VIAFLQRLSTPAHLVKLESHRHRPGNKTLFSNSNPCFNSFASSPQCYEARLAAPRIVPFRSYLLLLQSLPNLLHLYLDSYGTFMVTWVVKVSCHPRCFTPGPIALRSHRFCVTFPSSSTHRSRITSHSSPFYFQSLTKCNFRNSFLLTFMHVMGGMRAVLRFPSWTYSGDPLFFGQLLSFDILAHSFALIKNSTLLFSCDSALFHKNTRGWGTPTILLEDQNEPNNA
jgi:hypothetical protein